MLAVLVAEVGLLGAMMRGVDLVAWTTGHVAVVTALGVWAFHPANRTTRWALLLWIATTAFGPLGPGGMVLSMALERRHARRATGIAQWHAMLFPPTPVDEHAELWRRIGQRASDVPHDQPITPFLDVLTFGSVPQRQSVIAIIVQQFNPAFAPALKAALCDEHNVIRVQAATAIARLENEFLERTMRLEGDVQQSPHDDGAILALATHYDDQAFAGLLDPMREQDCRIKAVEGYERYLRQRTDDHAARFRLARLQQRRGQWREAERLFRELFAVQYPGTRHWFMESLYVQGRYAELRDVATLPAPDSDEVVSPEVAETIGLWRGENAA